MISLTQKEREALLILFKDYTAFYNANSISKVLGISHVGAQKIFKRFLNDGLVISKTIGKSIIYKPNLEDDYARSLIAFLLANEANNFKRWKDEFKGLFKEGRIIILFGSVLRNYKEARDIDLAIVIKKEEFKDVNAVIKQRQDILPKKIHSIEITKEDLAENIRKKQEAVLNMVKQGVILYGYEQYVEAIKNVTGF